MGLREIWAALRLSWWAPVVGLVLGAVAALALSLLQTRQYVSTTQLFVSATDSNSSYDVYSGSLFSEQRATSYAQLLTGDDLASRVVDDLGLRTSPEDLAEQVDATVVPDTVLLDVSVRDTSPSRAQDIARAIGDQFPRMVADLETVGGAETPPVKVTVVKPAAEPLGPSSPQPVRDGILGALAGLLIGAVVAIARARLDRSVKDAEEAAALAAAPVIGVVLRDEELGKRHVLDRASTSRTAEDFRQLRTNLQFLNVDRPPTVIMVSSAVPSEGKSTVVANLGLALADAGRTVTIVEADLRRPRVTRYLGMIGGAGLTNILAGSADLEDVLQRYGDRELSVIAAGPAPPNPGELLSSSQMSALVEKLRTQNDFVLVDAPPLLPVADSSGLAVLTDGVLLAVRYGETRKEQLQQAASALQRVGATTLGVILNMVPPKAELAMAYGYGYDYGYEPGRAPTS